MANRNKLQKFAELRALPNVYESYDPTNPRLTGRDGTLTDLRGQWAARHFRNDNPIVLELACGRGEYTLDLARRYPDRNFIGVDIKGARLWRGATYARDEGLENVAFLRTRIEVIDAFFAEGEVDEIWITFPDPFLKKGKENRRLTAPRFLWLYQKMLRPRPGTSDRAPIDAQLDTFESGLVHLKTDSRELYDFTMEVFEDQPAVELIYTNPDIYAGPLAFPALSTQTYYEKIHRGAGKPITYTRFAFRPGVAITGGRGIPGVNDVD